MAEVSEASILQCRKCDNANVPLTVLSCFHSLCKDCIEPSDDTIPTNCPVCGAHVSPIINDDNIASIVAKCVNMFNEEFRIVDDISCLVCRFNNVSNSASHVCLDCGDTLCEKCHKGHTLSSLTHAHRVVAVDDVKSGKYKLEASRKSPCANKKHGNMYCDMYCETCSEKICSACLLSTQHRGHAISPLEAEASRLKTESESLSEDLRRRRASVSRLLDGLCDQKGTVESTHEATIAAINRQARSFIESIEKQQQNAVEKVQKLNAQHLTLIEEEEMKVKQLSQSLPTLLCALHSSQQSSNLELCRKLNLEVSRYTEEATKVHRNACDFSSTLTRPIFDIVCNFNAAGCVLDVKEYLIHSGSKSVPTTTVHYVGEEQIARGEADITTAKAGSSVETDQKIQCQSVFKDSPTGEKSVDNTCGDDVEVSQQSTCNHSQEMDGRDTTLNDGTSVSSVPESISLHDGNSDRQSQTELNSTTLLSNENAVDRAMQSTDTCNVGMKHSSESKPLVLEEMSEPDKHDNGPVSNPVGNVDLEYCERIVITQSVAIVRTRGCSTGNEQRREWSYDASNDMNLIHDETPSASLTPFCTDVRERDCCVTNTSTEHTTKSAEDTTKSAEDTTTPTEDTTANQNNISASQNIASQQSKYTGIGLAKISVVKVGSATDNKKPKISGICKHNNKRIVVLDEANCLVRLVDPVKCRNDNRNHPNKLTSFFPRQGVACCDHEVIYVCGKTVHITDPSLALQYSFTIQSASVSCPVVICSYTSDSFLMANLANNMYRIYRTDGMILKEEQCPVEGPIVAASHAGASRILLSSWSRTGAVYLIKDGHVIQTIAPPEVTSWYPEGTCLDSRGNIYVASSHLHKIHVFLPNGDLWFVHSTLRDGLRSPRWLAIMFNDVIFVAGDNPELFEYAVNNN